MPKPSSNIAKFQRTLRSSKRIVVVAGAGLSAASGIPTFRGAGGLWKKYDAMSLATPEAFEENPSRTWQFYHMRREVALKASPNAAHYIIADLAFADKLREVAPLAESFLFITQNVDGLSVRALNERLAERNIPPILPNSASNPPRRHGKSLFSPIYEMHGRVHDVLCTNSACGSGRVWDDKSPICEALGRVSAREVDEPDFEAQLGVEELPRCEKCGALTRPGVVWFGERPMFMDEIDEAIEDADLCLVIGTSSTVFPAAAYAHEVMDNGGKAAVFNIERTAGDENMDFAFVGPCEETLRAALYSTSSDSE